MLSSPPLLLSAAAPSLIREGARLAALRDPASTHRNNRFSGTPRLTKPPARKSCTTIQITALCTPGPLRVRSSATATSTFHSPWFHRNRWWCRPNARVLQQPEYHSDRKLPASPGANPRSRLG